ncbi:MAG: leucine-rich repeat protein, partial [Clostridia bacterium]|nr:leucine-rich repeat protein [Clostridia bacterium]
IPPSVLHIGKRAFYGCQSLSNLELTTEGLTIGKEAFSYSISKAITLGAELGAIEPDAFTGAHIKDVHAPAKLLSLIPREYIVTLSVTGGTAIPTSAMLRAYMLESVELADDITDIGDTAFYECTALTDVKLGKEVKNIGTKAFAFTALTSLTLPDTVESIGESAFEECMLKSMSAPAAALPYLQSDTVQSLTVTSGTQIPRRTFFKWHSLETVYLADSITKIGDYAFFHRGALKNLRIGSDVTYVGKSLFEGSATLETTLFGNAHYIGNEDNPYVMLYKNESTGISECEIHPETKIIHEYAFQKCASLSKITIPDGVCQIGQYAFSYCTSLTDISIPQSIKYIGDRAFDRTEALSYNEHGGALYLGDENNPYTVLIKVSDTSITSVDIHQSTRHIYSHAFYYCGHLKEVNIPDTVVSIGGYAFYGSAAIESVSLGAAVERIGEYAFYGLSSLREISLPSPLFSVGMHAFSSCSSLYKVQFSVTEGWTCDEVAVSADILTDTATAAQYIRNTKAAYAWERAV